MATHDFSQKILMCVTIFHIFLLFVNFESSFIALVSEPD